MFTAATLVECYRYILRHVQFVKDRMSNVSITLWTYAQRRSFLRSVSHNISETFQEFLFQTELLETYAKLLPKMFVEVFVFIKSTSLCEAQLMLGRSRAAGRGRGRSVKIRSLVWMKIKEN